MGCNCKNKRKNYQYIKRLAVKFARVNKEVVQIYKETDNNQIFYNFEPLDDTRENIKEIIRP